MSEIKQLPIRVSEQELKDIEWLRRQLGERSMAHAVRRVLRETVETLRLTLDHDAKKDTGVVATEGLGDKLG